MKVLLVENHAVFAATVIDQFLSAHDVTALPTVLGAPPGPRQVAKSRIVPAERMERAILVVRGHKVMLDVEEGCPDRPRSELLVTASYRDGPT